MGRNAMQETARVLVLLAATSPAPALAAAPQVRRGFWWSLGAGYGTARIRCDQCASGGREGSFAGWLRLGGTIGEHVLVGWEASGWLSNAKGGVATSEDLTRTLGSSAIILAVYPRASSGLSLRIGVGLSYAGLPPRPASFCPPLDLECLAHVDQGVHGNGPGMTVGIGYDIRVGTNVSLTPDLSFTFGRPGELSAGGARAVTGWRHDVLALGMGVTFH